MLSINITMNNMPTSLHTQSCVAAENRIILVQIKTEIIKKKSTNITMAAYIQVQINEIEKLEIHYCKSESSTLSYTISNH